MSPAPHYTEPVDPWATAEAAAIAAAGGAAYHGPPVVGGPVGADGLTGVEGLTGLNRYSRQRGADAGLRSWLASADGEDEPTAPAASAWGASAGPGRGPESPGLLRRAYRKKVLWVGLVVVLAVAATLVVVLWPGYRSLDYRPLGSAVHIAAAGPVSSAFADAEVLGDRAYFASADTNGALGVVAAGTDGKRLWGSSAAGTATRWMSMVALPDGVAVFSDTESATSRRRMVVLGANDGKVRWQRSLAGSDQVYFIGATAVLVDTSEHRLVGLKINNGGTAWELPDRKTDYGTTAAVIPVTTVEDVSGPARVDGRASAPNRGDDTRLVQVSADRSARVIDAKDGKVLVQPRQSVAAPNDEVIAHNGRLFVREDTDAHRIVAYDLAKLGEPKVLYTAADTNHQISDLVPCGETRACFIERVGYDAKQARVVSVDAGKGGHWSTAVPNADNLVPVGESVLVTRNTSPDSVALLDGDGKAVWTRDGAAARLNAGNVLLFSADLSTVADGPAVSGQHLGDSVVPLGALSEVRTASCSWNTAVLACVGDKDLVLQKFTG